MRTALAALAALAALLTPAQSQQAGSRAAAAPAAAPAIVAETEPAGFSGVLWRVSAAASAGLTDQAAQLFSHNVDRTLRALHISRETVVYVLGIVANLGFCLVLLVGFVYLPPDFMLIVGLVTFFVGPTLVLLLLQLITGVYVVTHQRQHPIASSSHRTDRDSHRTDRDGMQVLCGGS